MLLSLVIQSLVVGVMGLLGHLPRHVGRLRPMPVLVSLDLVDALRECIVTWSLLSHVLLLGGLMHLLLRIGLSRDAALP